METKSQRVVKKKAQLGRVPSGCKFAKADAVVVYFSGGLDSSTVLHYAVEETRKVNIEPRRVVAIHVFEDQDMYVECKNVCADLGVTIATILRPDPGYVDELAKSTGTSTYDIEHGYYDMMAVRVARVEYERYVGNTCACRTARGGDIRMLRLGTTNADELEHAPKSLLRPRHLQKYEPLARLDRLGVEELAKTLGVPDTIIKRGANTLRYTSG